MNKNENAWEQLTGIELLDVSELIKATPPIYQRDVSHDHVKDLEHRIDVWGWFPNSIIMINHLRQLIDGYHRCLACIKLGIIKVPTIQVKFIDAAAEAQYFLSMNEYSRTLSLLDSVKAKYAAGVAGIEKLYRLEQDPNCVLFEKINLKYPGLPYKASSKKFLLNTVAKAISHMFDLPMLGTPKEFDKSNTFEEKIEVIPYEALLIAVNVLFGVVGTYDSGPCRRQNHVSALAKAYRVMRVTSEQTDKHFRERMLRFLTPIQWFTSSYTHGLRVITLIRHLNKQVKNPAKRIDDRTLDT